MASAAATNPIDILIVEDNPYEMELTTHALTENKLSDHVKAVSDGAEALDFLFGQGAYAARDPTQRPKIILLDLNMPRMGGLEVLRRIKADSRTRNIPVVVLTHANQDENVMQAYRLGASSFILKSSDFEEFVKGILAMGTFWIAMNRPPISDAV